MTHSRIDDPRVPPPDRSALCATATGAPQSPESETDEGRAREPVHIGFGAHQGVVLFFDDQGRTVQIAATSNTKRFIASRLGELDEDNQPATTTTLREVAHRVESIRTGSAFEADWLTLTLARELDQRLHTQLAARLRTTVLVLDDLSHTWRVEEIGPDSVVPRGSHWFGPCRRPDHARAVGEALDDCFDLCRYPKELARAPKGTPCAYKDMGKCPAPCDGSEPISAYTERYEHAKCTLVGGLDAWRTETKAALQTAAADLDFERAQRLKETLDTISEIPDEARRHALALQGRVLVVVSRATRRAWVTLWSLGSQGLLPVAALHAPSMTSPGSKAALQSLIERLAQTEPIDPSALSPESLEELGLVARARFHKPRAGAVKRTRVLDSGSLSPKTLVDAVTQCVGDPDDENENPDHPERDGDDPIAYNNA